MNGNSNIQVFKTNVLEYTIENCNCLFAGELSTNKVTFLLFSLILFTVFMNYGTSIANAQKATFPINGNNHWNKVTETDTEQDSNPITWSL